VAPMRLTRSHSLEDIILQIKMSLRTDLRDCIGDSVGREVLYNILTEFGIPMKLVRLIKLCLNETKSV
jgi:hypothetical protein